MCILCGTRINKIFDSSIQPLPSAKEFYDNPDNQFTSIIYFGDLEHGVSCDCCTPRKIVEHNEKMREQKWKEIRSQRKLTKKGREYLDRWNREREQFDKWQMKWGFC